MNEEMVDSDKLVCKICSKEYNSFASIAQHIRFSHKIKNSNYFDEFFKKDEEGKCIECGKQTRFICLKDGYERFCSDECRSTSKTIIEQRKATYFKRTGYYAPTQNPEVKIKCQTKCEENYGCRNPSQSKEIQNKKIATCQERFGFDNAMKNKDVVQKLSNTFQLKYGVDWGTKHPTIKQKSKESCNKKYGFDYSLQSPIVRDKINNTVRNLYGVDYTHQNKNILKKFQDTCQKKFGYMSPLQSDIIKEKIKKSCLLRFGVDNPFKSSTVIDKIRKTNELNGLWLPANQTTKLQLYYRYVLSCTRKSLSKKYSKEELIQKRVDGFHADHKYSIIEGFKNNISPYIIGCQSNIELIPALDNHKKYIKCSITKEELFELYENELKGDNETHCNR